MCIFKNIFLLKVLGFNTLFYSNELYWADNTLMLTTQLHDNVSELIFD